MSSPKTVTVELGIGELMSLIHYNRDIVDHIPAERYHQMTMAGHTLGVTAQKHKDRLRELEDLLHNTWPK